MPVRLLRPYGGQAVNTLFWGIPAVEDQLRGSGTGDDQIALASDYAPNVRYFYNASGNIVPTASQYIFTGGGAQTLGLRSTGYFPIGTLLFVTQLGAGQVTIVPDPSVTVSTALTSLVTKGQYAVGILQKVGASQWVAFDGFGG